MPCHCEDEDGEDGKGGKDGKDELHHCGDPFSWSCCRFYQTPVIESVVAYCVDAMDDAAQEVLGEVGEVRRLATGVVVGDTRQEVEK